MGLLWWQDYCSRVRVGQMCSWAAVEQRRLVMDVLGGDDAAQLHHPGRVGHGHGWLAIGREQGNTVSKTVRNDNRRGKGESLALWAHR